MSNILLLRTCEVKDSKLAGYGGFPYPESGEVTAPEEWNPEWGEKPAEWKGGFDPEIECGAGLHGVSDLGHDWGLLNWDIEAKALVIIADSEKSISLSIEKVCNI